MTNLKRIGEGNIQNVLNAKETFHMNYYFIWLFSGYKKIECKNCNLH